MDVRLKLLLILIVISVPFSGEAQFLESNKSLKVLSWNIHMLPSFIYSKTKKIKRADEIITALETSAYNIILFQEAFNSKVRNKIRKKLQKKYRYAYGPVNKKIVSLRTNSGLWILSDRPLIVQKALAFDECFGQSCLARKGAMLVQGDHYGHLFQLINSHTSGGPVNNYQLHLIREKLLDPFSKDKIPQIICGDFNTRTVSVDDRYNAMLRIFDVRDQYQQFDDRSDFHKQNWKIENVYAEWPDFIFLKENNDDLIRVKRIATRSIGPTWHQGDKKAYLETVGLSDHYPVMIELYWSSPDKTPITSMY